MQPDTTPSSIEADALSREELSIGKAINRAARDLAGCHPLDAAAESA